MKVKLRRSICILLALMMAFTIMFPAAIYADDESFEEFITEEEFFPLEEDLWIEEYYDDSEVVDESEFYEEEAGTGDEVYEEFYEEEFTASEEEFGGYSDDSDFEERNEFALSDDETFSAGLYISEHPASVTKAVDENAEFTVVAEGATSYQWYLSQDNGTTWTKMNATRYTGTKTATVTVKATEARDGWQFRCTVSDGTTTIDSNAATLTVAKAFEISEHPASVTKAVDENAEFTVVAEGATSYQWYLSQDNGTTWTKMNATRYPGTTTATVTVKAIEARDGWQFRCTVSDGTTTINSNAATLTVIADVTVDDVVYSKLSDGTGYYVKAYIGSELSVKVLNEINGLPVTEIGADAFVGNTTIQSVSLPNSIMTIRERAFKGCTNLSNMSSY